MFIDDEQFTRMSRDLRWLHDNATLLRQALEEFVDRMGENAAAMTSVIADVRSGRNRWFTIEAAKAMQDDFMRRRQEAQQALQCLTATDAPHQADEDTQ